MMEFKKRSQIGVATVVCAVFVVLSLVGVHKDKLIFVNPPYPKLLNTSFEDHAVVQVASFRTSTAALLIVDLAFRDPHNSSNIVIKRRILDPRRDEIYISQLQLLVPTSIAATNPFNTSQLAVDLTKIGVGSRTLVAPAFATGSLRSDPDAKSDVLVIGLGGAQMNNYLHHKFPKMNITTAELEASMVEMARKYFGLEEDDTQRVFAIDGLDYLQKAVKEENKFDAIYIDACPTSQAKEIEVMCPVPIFLEDKNIALIRNALKETGSVVTKLALFSDDVEEKAETLTDLYRKHFANCAILGMVELVNRAIVCSREGISKERYERKTLLDNMAKFYTSTGLKDEECCFYAVNECCSAT